jgi:ubiquinone biosynthesis protein UbiJ
MFANSRVFVIENNAQDSVDVDITLNKKAFLSLFNGASFEELIENDEIEINGSIKTAQQLADLMALSSIDIEELVSQYTGDIIAYQLGKTLNVIKGKSIQDTGEIFENFKNELTTLLVAPSRSKIFKNKAS